MLGWKGVPELEMKHPKAARRHAELKASAGTGGQLRRCGRFNGTLSLIERKSTLAIQESDPRDAQFD